MASELANSVVKSLEDQKYDIISASKPKKYVEGVTSEIIDNYLKGKRGVVQKMEMNTWKFKDFNPNSELTFTEHMDLVGLERYIDSAPGDVAQTVDRTSIPVTKIRSGQDIVDVEEFLMVNVVAPSFWEQLKAGLGVRKI